MLIPSIGFCHESEAAYSTIEWNDLLTEEDIKALMEPPDEFNNITDGSEQDQLTSALANALGLASDSDYQRALTSTIVREEYNLKKVRIAGFIVPITLDNKQNISEFFLVPYFGACIHMPPPPPNQIIFSKIPQPFKLDDIYSPYWVEGTLKTKLIENDLATSAYAIEVDKLELYSE